MFKVIQLSDCHVPAAAGTPYRGMDARATLEALLPVINAWAPDLVLATGDLSEDGSAEAYDWLAKALAGLHAPLLVTPGNHDDAALMASRFEQAAHEQALVFDASWRVIVLNSAVAGEVTGRISNAQLAQLDAALEDSSRPVLVALHHQPQPVGSPWIDRFPLLDPELLLARLRAAPQVKVVLWGHVHQAISLSLNGPLGLGAPSTVSNSLPGEDRFTPDPAGPAVRWLELAPDGEVTTGLLRAS
ncbi:MAG: metallophosphoesterase [Xanthomonadales bacterium]|nr:metallophosphoesterase [Xanthomonadales bacterium]